MIFSLRFDIFGIEFFLVNDVFSNKLQVKKIVSNKNKLFKSTSYFIEVYRIVNFCLCLQNQQASVGASVYHRYHFQHQTSKLFFACVSI